MATIPFLVLVERFHDSEVLHDFLTLTLTLALTRERGGGAEDEGGDVGERGDHDRGARVRESVGHPFRHGHLHAALVRVRARVRARV